MNRTWIADGLKKFKMVKPNQNIFTKYKEMYLINSYKNPPAPTAPDGLFAYYNFNDNVLDSFGNWNGTPTNITYVAGKMGNSAVFNGTALIKTIPILTYSSFSVFCWIKTTQTAEQLIFSNRSTSSFQIVQMAIYQGKINTRIRSAANTNIITVASSNTVNNNAWRFVGFTFNVTTGLIQHYIDGVANTSGTYTGGTFEPFGYSAIGVDAYGFTYGKFIGGIDGMSFFNKDLTAAEVTAIYDTQNAGSELI